MVRLKGGPLRADFVKRRETRFTEDERVAPKSRELAALGWICRIGELAVFENFWQVSYLVLTESRYLWDRKAIA